MGGEGKDPRGSVLSRQHGQHGNSAVRCKSWPIWGGAGLGAYLYAGDLRRELYQQDMVSQPGKSKYTDHLLSRLTVSPVRRYVELVKVAVRDLLPRPLIGMGGRRAGYRKICQLARAQGLELCPDEAACVRALSMRGRTEGLSVIFATLPTELPGDEVDFKDCRLLYALRDKEYYAKPMLEGELLFPYQDYPGATEFIFAKKETR
jgi:hypothetical protein